MDIYGVNERVNWKARTDERLVVFDMSFKKYDHFEGTREHIKR